MYTGHIFCCWPEAELNLCSKYKQRMNLLWLFLMFCILDEASYEATNLNLGLFSVHSHFQCGTPLYCTLNMKSELSPSSTYWLNGGSYDKQKNWRIYNSLPSLFYWLAGPLLSIGHDFHTVRPTGNNKPRTILSTVYCQDTIYRMLFQFIYFIVNTNYIYYTVSIATIIIKCYGAPITNTFEEKWMEFHFELSIFFFHFCPTTV